MEFLANFTPNIMENHGNFFQVLANNPDYELFADVDVAYTYFLTKLTKTIDNDSNR